jgi:hypothetical protein
VVAFERKKWPFFARRSGFLQAIASATVKKICGVELKIGLFGPSSVPPNQLQNQFQRHYLSQKAAIFYC